MIPNSKMIIAPRRLFKSLVRSMYGEALALAGILKQNLAQAFSNLCIVKNFKTVETICGYL